MAINVEKAKTLLDHEFKWGTSEAHWVERELREFQGRLRKTVENESDSYIAELRDMRPTLQKVAALVGETNKRWIADALAIIP